MQLQLRLKIAGTGNVTKRLKRPGNGCIWRWVGCPQHPEDAGALSGDHHTSQREH